MSNNVAITKPSPEPGTLQKRSGFGIHGWTVIGTQAVMFWVAAGAVTHGLNITLPALSKAYHLDYNTLLALATPASWASIAAGPCSAWLCEKKGAKFNIILCLIASALCYGFLGYASSLTAFSLLFAGACFFSTGFAYVGGTTVMASWFVKKNGLALGWCTIGQTFSSAFYVPVLAMCLGFFGVQYGFWGIGGLMFALAIFVFFFIYNHPEEIGQAPDNEPLVKHNESDRSGVEEDDDTPCKVSDLLRMKDIWLMGIGTGAIYIMLVGVVSQLVPRLMESGYTLNQAILFMSASALFGTFGAYGWGWLNQHLGVKKAIMSYTLWWMVSILLNLFSDNVVCLWASLLMIGFSLPGATNLSTALIATKFPRHYYVRAIGIVHPVQSVVRCFSFSLLAFGLAYLGGYTGAYIMFIGVGVITLLLLSAIDTTPISETMKKHQ